MSTRTPRLSDLPLWRLLVALHDAETAAGPDSESVELLSQVVESKLRQLHVRRGLRVIRPTEGGSADATPTR
jgi:hypothetical protein